MAKRDGYSLVSSIRSHADERIRGVPAVAVTGYARPEERDRALAVGFSAHVAKPVELEELIKIVAALVAREHIR
jgi:CheY-like chemotaxis protein